MPKIQDLTGKIFGRLEVLAFDSIRKDKQGKSMSYWVCKCLCESGNIKIACGASLKNGGLKSCGCLHKESLDRNLAAFLKRSTTHGLSKTPEFYIWSSMKERCNNPKNKSFPQYGAVGIKVCDRWLHSFENFIRDVGKRPSSFHSLDRYPNMAGNYEPNNVRWATRIEQNNNTKSNVFYEIDGIQIRGTDAPKHLNIGKTAFYRYIRRGFTAQQIKVMAENRKGFHF